MNHNGERYTDWKQVGEGATAFVYQVYDNELQMLVAVKLLKEKCQTNKRLLEGMRHEIKISRELRHPNICPIHDFYDGEKGLGIVMDFISGIELRDWMDDNQTNLLSTANERLQLLQTIASTLQIAHQRIIHRDLKPANIFLLNGDISTPIIMDFGIATMGEGGNDSISGTPKYMSPEQYLAPQKVDHRSDLFALGIIAYELFTNKIPPCSLRGVIKSNKPPRIAITDIPPPSHYCHAVPAALDQLILQSLSYEQQNRPATTAEVNEALQQVKLIERSLSGLGSSEVDTPRITIPGGVSYIGSGPKSSYSNEKPRRKVELLPFEIDTTPVTNRMYRNFIERTGYQHPPFIDDPLFGKDDHPVVGITWEDASTYAEWANGELPTEAQWEIAAKGGERFPEYPWGETPPTPSHANIDNILTGTSPVGSYINGSNSYQLLDLCGNVWEWCRDEWDEHFYSSLSNGEREPLSSGTDNSQEATLRGGAFDTLPSMGRCAFRFHAPKESRRKSIGFRLVYKTTSTT